jgi:AICAR transformylase/IMP cyclohydrolase PurH
VEVIRTIMPTTAAAEVKGMVALKALVRVIKASRAQQIVVDIRKVKGGTMHRKHNKVTITSAHTIIVTTLAHHHTGITTNNHMSTITPFIHMITHIITILLLPLMLLLQQQQLLLPMVLQY